VSPVKTCACGRAFTAAEWFALDYVGPLYIPPGDDPETEPPEHFDLRNCVCGSTLSGPTEKDRDRC